MHHKILLTLLLSTLALGATAQIKPAGKKAAAVKSATLSTVKEAPAEEAKATGPNGFGPVKIDMSKDALEALTPNDGVYLSSALAPKEKRGDAQPDGTVSYTGKMTTPLSPTPIDTEFTFHDGKLSFFSMDLRETAFDFAQKQIADKYGAGEVKGDLKEKQCIYENGSNFKVLDGLKIATWRHAISTTEQIVTSATDMQMASCPSSLDDPLNSMKKKWVSFERAPIKSENKENLF